HQLDLQVPFLSLPILVCEITGARFRWLVVPSTLLHTALKVLLSEKLLSADYLERFPAFQPAVDETGSWFLCHSRNTSIASPDRLMKMCPGTHQDIGRDLPTVRSH